MNLYSLTMVHGKDNVSLNFFFILWIDKCGFYNLLFGVETVMK